jgi:RNA polymerase sigma factor (TIGR02999 family)
MTESSRHATITELLQAVNGGDRAALDALLPLIYDELRVLARRQRGRWRGDPSLNTTALVHEAYLKVGGQKRLPAESRTHFFVVAARAMRHILCNHARDRRRQKRGGGVMHVSLEPESDLAAFVDLSDDHSDVLAELDDSLRELERLAERQARVVECRYFGGMSVEETAAALGISPRTVKRDWTFARAWLRRDIQRRIG